MLEIHSALFDRQGTRGMALERIARSTRSIAGMTRPVSGNVPITTDGCVWRLSNDLPANSRPKDRLPALFIRLTTVGSFRHQKTSDMNKFYWMAIGLLLGLVNLRAEIKLPALVGDNMVLQQATKSTALGNATPNSSLKVRSSWDNTEYTAQVNDQGRWEIWVQTPSASFEKQQLTLENGQDKIVLHDLLIGEVWFGSGQSNMEMPLRGFWHCPIEGGNHAIATSGNIRTRSVTLRSNESEPWNRKIIR